MIVLVLILILIIPIVLWRLLLVGLDILLVIELLLLVLIGIILELLLLLLLLRIVLVIIECVRIPLIIILLLWALNCSLLWLLLLLLILIIPWIWSKVWTTVSRVVWRCVGVVRLWIFISFRCNSLCALELLSGTLRIHWRLRLLICRRWRRIHLPAIIEAKETRHSLDKTRLLYAMW